MSDYEQLREALQERASEPRVKRMWDRIDGARRRPARPPSARWKAVGVVGVAAAAIALFVFVPRASEPAPLTLEGAAPLAGALAAGDEVRLSDGSRIEVDEDARLDVLESSARTVALALRHGRARFEVTPGGPRGWRVDCGAVTVEVVGTVFTITRDGAHVAVAVERGSVLVRGDDVPDHVQRLEAGDALEVAPAAPEVAAIAAAEPIEAAAPALDPPAPVPPRVESERRAVRAEVDVDPVATLLARADAARRRRDLPEAARALDQVVREHAADQRAALAAYSLARLRLDRLDQPRAAAGDFARALALGLPDQLAEGALAGRAVALARSGDPRAAAALAEYLAEYPEGRYRGEVQRWQRAL